MPTIKDLKTTLTTNKAGRFVHERLLDQMELPKFHTGGLKQKLIRTAKTKPLDFKSLLAVQPNNPFLLERRIAQGIVPETLVGKDFRIGSAQVLAPGAGGSPAGGRGKINFHLDRICPSGLARISRMNRKQEFLKAVEILAPNDQFIQRCAQYIGSPTFPGVCSPIAARSISTQVGRAPAARVPTRPVLNSKPPAANSFPAHRCSL